VPGTVSGIDQLSAPSDIKVYPTPAGTILNISINPLFGDTRKLEVYDLMGKMVMEQDINKNTTLISLNVSEINNGNYFLRIVGDSTQRISRFTVAR
ncbi:MAG TPA: T9SS type A sorting domain-containing protein, partial [Bacteroidia bacterium]|nr:T9SS type A sorting domain-containing protein [Bacteroidia bacterium]